MCGISGFWGEGDADTLERMNDAHALRGPDDRGVYHEGQVGLAQTRLAIIDVSPGGHQPMISRSGDTVLVFNGEIYNYKELREDLRSKGLYQFKSESDTEVILALYEAYGVSGFSKLNGMFTIALYDKKRDELVLVRDRMGKKPLYWGMHGGTLLFASEPKALMCHKKFAKELDLEALRLYLVYEAVPTPRSIFTHTHKLEGGTYLVYRPGSEPRIEHFWQKPEGELDLSFEEAKRGLDTLLAQSVERRLVSDVPLGVFLSGGLDSSTIAYYASRNSAEQLKTFSIGFTNKDFDESQYATEVARVLGVDHHTEYFSPQTCLDVLSKMFAYLDEPIADSSILPTYLLSSFARQHVTVALAGDGSDELFAGYPTFRAASYISYYEALPHALRANIIEPLVHALPVGHGYFSFDFKLKRFIDGAGVPARYRHQRWMGAFTDQEAQELLRDQPATVSAYAHLDQFFTNHAQGSAFNNDVLWSYARTYLMDEVLAKVDRASMANSLEVRAPFLDYTVVDFVQRLPYEYKFRLGEGKRILKSLMSKRLPRDIVYRKKRGFAMPTGRWLQHELKPVLDDLLSKEAIEKAGIFNYAVVEKLRREHDGGAVDHRKKLWTLLVFQLWLHNWYT